MGFTADMNHMYTTPLCFLLIIVCLISNCNRRNRRSGQSFTDWLTTGKAQFIAADNTYIQYFGRWDMSDPRQPSHSWPGVYLRLKFSGNRIGIRIADEINYYNVYLDGHLRSVFHGDQPGESNYLLADNLKDGPHLLEFTKRNISFGKHFSILGFWLDKNAGLLPPPPKPARKIEFIGNSFTAAEGNEATLAEMPWEEKMPVTNIDQGFAVIIARHFQAQYHTTCRSGIGMVCDWTGDFEIAMPQMFDRTLMDFAEPKWDFRKWQPDLAVICLGLNDFSGLKDKDGNVSAANSALFRKTYHEFIATVRRVYPEAKILAVAAHPEWIRQNVSRVVEEEKKSGRQDIYYAQFNYFPDGYVANGHPNVATHHKIADQLIEAISTIGIFKDSQ
jgi:hypothetical protein